MAKKTRKELLKKEDAFINAAAQGAEWAKENKIVLIAGAAAVAVVIAAVWGGAEYVRLQNLTASVTLDEALRFSEKAVVADGEDETADPAADPPSFASKEEKQKAALAKLQAVVDGAGISGIGDLARFYVANLQQELADDEAARATLNAVASSMGTRDSLFFLAVERAAYQQEKMGDKEGAIQTLDRLAQMEGGFYADRALFHQGRLYQQLGQIDKARTTFEKIETEFPDSLIKEEVAYRLDTIGRTPSEEVAAATPTDGKDTPAPASGQADAPAKEKAADPATDGKADEDEPPVQEPAKEEQSQ